MPCKEYMKSIFAKDNNNNNINKRINNNNKVVFQWCILTLLLLNVLYNADWTGDDAVINRFVGHEAADY